MKNFQKKRGWQNIVQSKPFLIIFGFVLLIFSWNVFGLWSKMQETRRSKKIIENKVAALKQQKENLSSEINSLNTAEGKEKFFRENLGLAKEGEDMIVIVEDKNPPKTLKPNSSGFLSFLFFWKNWLK